MRNVFKLALLLIVSCTFGCAHNYYNIPQETLEKKVKVIGVAPIFTDAESDIRHPEKGSLVSLIKGYNAKNEKELIARLRTTGYFYAVRPVEGDPDRLFLTLLANRERRDDAGIIYNKYFYKKEQLQQILADNGLDALLLVTVSGLTKPEKVYSSNFLAYLDTDYNYLTMTAQLLDRDGQTIWEYPNFRRSALSYPMFFRLQYPDFDEAAANLSEKVDVKFKTIAGINAAFAKTEASAVNGPPVSVLYAKQYEEILSLLKPYSPLFGGKKKEEGAPAVEPAPQSAPAPAAPEAAPAPAAPAAPQKQTPPAARQGSELPSSAPVAAPAAEVVPERPSGEIVPEQPSGDVVPEQPAAQ